MGCTSSKPEINVSEAGPRANNITVTEKATSNEGPNEVSTPPPKSDERGASKFFSSTFSPNSTPIQAQSSNAIIPLIGFVIKLKKIDDSKVFINVFHHDAMSMDTIHVCPPKKSTDKKGEEADLYDTVIATSLFSTSVVSDDEKMKLCQQIIAKVNADFRESLPLEKFVLPKIKKGFAGNEIAPIYLPTPQVCDSSQSPPPQSPPFSTSSSSTPPPSMPPLPAPASPSPNPNLNLNAIDVLPEKGTKASSRPPTPPPIERAAALVDSSETLPPVIFGNLLGCGDSDDTFTKHYYVLGKGAINWYNSVTDSEPLGTVELKGTTVLEGKGKKVTIAPCHTAAISRSNAKANNNEKAILILDIEDDEERKRWVEGIHKNITYAQKEIVL